MYLYIQLSAGVRYLQETASVVVNKERTRNEMATALWQTPVRAQEGSSLQLPQSSPFPPGVPCVVVCSSG
jgi:hypothetical protein